MRRISRWIFSPCVTLAFSVLFSSAPTCASPSPAEDEVLRLVPPGAEIVAGIADPGSQRETGRLLVVTANNNLDFDDCLALLGVDGGRTITQVVQVASSEHSRNLEHHLLLLRGRFNRTAIFTAALRNGRSITRHNDQEVLVILPFPREKDSTIGVRWLAILNDRVLLFGSPSLVHEALLRFELHQPTDPALARHLAQLDRDVDSWSIIALTPTGASRLILLDPRLAFLKAILEQADAFAIGIHYAHHARVSFAVQSRTTLAISSDVLRAQLVQAGLVSVQALDVRPGSTNQGDLRGAFKISATELDRWLASVQLNRSSFP